MVQEPDGRWELPGGGIDFGENPEQTIKREIKEELKIKTKKVNKNPLYIWIQEAVKNNNKYYRLFLAYKVKVESFNFKATKEAVQCKFFNKSEMKRIKLHMNIVKFKKLLNAKDLNEKN